jgi:hypothetical protein
MRDLNREIEVVENIIEILNRCLVVHKLEKQASSVVSCLNDIRLCKKELKRLKAEKEQIRDAPIR